MFPEEFFAFINAEVAANLNLMAEARGRPRPSLLNAAADQDDEKDMGCRAEPADVADENSASDKEADDGPQPLQSKGVVYKPLRPVHADDVFKTVHRVVDPEKVDGRAGDAGKQVSMPVLNILCNLRRAIDSLRYSVKVVNQ